MNRLEAMLTLVAVVDAGSLSEASRRARVPLATVSRRVSDLEQHLGTALLQRSARALSLTDAGRAYVDACRRILEQVEEAERIARGEYSELKGQLFLVAHPSARKNPRRTNRCRIPAGSPKYRRAADSFRSRRELLRGAGGRCPSRWRVAGYRCPSCFLSRRSSDRRVWEPGLLRPARNTADA